MIKSFVPLCIALNVIVFLLWRTLPREFMFENFTVSWLALSQSRFWTLVTSAFSHIELWHLLINMFVLNSFGPVLEHIVGKTSFWRFYIFAAIIGSLAHAVVSKFLMNQAELPAVGASGAIAGVILLFALKFPKEKILLFGIVPVPALIGSMLFIGIDVWGLIAQTKGGGLGIGHGAHLGGSLAGLLYYLMYIK
ncbi:MAG TPA: rhomboid family intramembrane serine protease [Oligoflexia bacterium]|nr:rhomboid family intramembrane serine protease [Oligoflexia bacterium]HMR24257.1 rhomboid family intramembrane serine protease [Oligoflexia bacterium]